MKKYGDHGRHAVVAPIIILINSGNELEAEGPGLLDGFYLDVFIDGLCQRKDGWMCDVSEEGL